MSNHNYDLVKLNYLVHFIKLVYIDQKDCLTPCQIFNCTRKFSSHSLPLGSEILYAVAEAVEATRLREGLERPGPQRARAAWAAKG